MNYQAILNRVQSELHHQPSEGRVPDYIPELDAVSADKFGLHLSGISGRNFYFGDSEEKFSIQSISKVFSLALAKKHQGMKIWERVDVEPSGTPFNSLTQLENEDGIPRNPLINSGALVIADILVSKLENPKDELLELVRELTQDKDIDYDRNVVASEEKYGYRNSALVNYMKSLGNIESDTHEVLDFYYHQCSLAMSCRQLAQSFLVFAQRGKRQGKTILKPYNIKRINAIMQTCGFYDEAGEFSFRVGLPGKSGVGGGIVAVHPKEYSVAVWSPPLNKNGNSAKGMLALERLTSLTGLSIF